MIDIKKRIIPQGRRNRPMTNPASSLYRKTMRPVYITIHNTGNRSASATAANHAIYLTGVTAANVPVSWHFTVDDLEVWQHLPLDESGWHAGDNLGPGNTTTIGIEICENHLPDNMNKYLEAENNAAWLCAQLIKDSNSLRPFPECMKQHFDWSGKNCPSVIRGRSNGWNVFLSKIEGHLKQPKPPAELPEVQRTIAVEIDGKMTDIQGYLINNSTYVHAAPLVRALGYEISGHGDHVKVRK